MSKKTTTLTWYSAVPLWLLISFAYKNPEAIEKYYSRLFYPFFFDLHQYFTDLIPFSLGDLLYSTAVIFLLRSFYKKIPYWKAKPKNIILDFGAVTIMIIWIFHLSWGFNYHRVPLSKQLKISISYNKKDLEDRIDKIIEQSNYWHDHLVSSDTLAVQFPFSKDEILQKTHLKNPFYEESILKDLKVKKSLLSLPLSYMGYAGYLNPFTLESQVNERMPLMSLITTSLHEKAHQLGYASEKEANFIAYFSAITSDDPYFQYAGNTFAFRYFYSEFYKLEPEKAKEKLKMLRPGILKDFKEVSNFWKKYENPFEIVFDKTYNVYLKANGQIKGIKSYNEMVGLVINYHKNKERFLQCSMNYPLNL